MRTIKFRGANRDEGWVYGNLILGRKEYSGENLDKPVYAYIARFNNNGEVFPIEPIRVAHSTVGQFTGLYDKNGREIYDGDIVECVSWNEFFNNPETGDVMEPFRRKMYVDFRNGGFKMIEKLPKPLKDNEWDIISNGDIIVIGNIYDNPELITNDF